ncbi:fructoselysine-6-P-deglycase FrlB-like protein [Propionibacteriaceae bacterium ES.041]|uniref:Sugar isomerase n=1 Tax=Enemella evansiae TaxID=2016499 RepID=A0A255G7Z1_9ACTN|nr:sugar isomerase [Enemella evansiae]PFG66157.1 fructoselysine-6-P-deglycase FrlB-like protein [Propionibacteriaceae bacterium ES.041]OYN94964.1 sugar isomerase [Enemella evansiae]OYO04840.1 sugar isomerase [Enemella evansiae]OYO08992.1 sugar isomerase [Enemella evansiae]OYO11661.1 sugar isomerase [Enemella evansiae]
MPFLTDDEIGSQPECWQRAGELLPEVAHLLPADGERVAFVGTGTAWYIAQSMAALREAAGMGQSDAFTASECPRDRGYQRLVVLSRSGRTTDINRLLSDVGGRIPTLAVVGDVVPETSPTARLAEASIDLSFADEASVVQTRFATTALALVRAWVGDPLAEVVRQATEALQYRLTEEMADVEQITYLGHGWTIGLAQEAALKFRQCTQSWAEAYPAMEYRHGPIAVAEPGRVVWSFGRPPYGLAAQVRDTGATFVDHDIDPMADLIIAQRLAVARAMKLGLNPDAPRNLTRAVVLAD